MPTTGSGANSPKKNALVWFTIVPESVKRNMPALSPKTAEGFRAKPARIGIHRRSIA